MAPIVSVIGNSESGKTTLIEKLVQELNLCDYRVATTKHIPQGVNFDESDKDSWRHIQAGSEAASVSSAGMAVPATMVARLGHMEAQ